MIISLAKVSGRTPDPEVVSFAEAAERDPRFAAAENIVERYRQAKGYPPVTAERMAEHRAALEKAVAFVKARGWENGGRLGAASSPEGESTRALAATCEDNPGPAGPTNA